MRDGNGTRSIETLMRYRGAAMAELTRSLRTLKALQAEARTLAAADLPATPPARQSARHLVARPNEPENLRRISASKSNSAVESQPAAPDRNLPTAAPAPLPPPVATTQQTREDPRPRRGRRGAPDRDLPDTSQTALTASLARTKRTRKSTSDQDLDLRLPRRSAA
jgi:hypothetical protein